jgi:hypothetical protein
VRSVELPRLDEPSHRHLTPECDLSFRPESAPDLQFCLWFVCVVLHQSSSSRGPAAAQSDAMLTSAEPQAVSSNGSGIGLRSSWIRLLRS